MCDETALRQTMTRQETMHRTMQIEGARQTSLRDHALAGCRLKTHKKIHTFGANSLQMLITMVANDLGVTLVPDMALGLLAGTGLRAVKLPQDEFYRDIGFAWRKGHSRAKTLDALMSLLPTPSLKPD